MYIFKYFLTPNIKRSTLQNIKLFYNIALYFIFEILSSLVDFIPNICHWTLAGTNEVKTDFKSPDYEINRQFRRCFLFIEAYDTNRLF